MFGLERPQIFAIALLRDRSLTDLTALEQLLDTGPDAKKFSGMRSEIETLRPLIDRGDGSAVNRDLGGSAFFEPYMSKAPPNPEEWWIVEAGMASVDADAARVDLLAGDLQSIHPMWLAGHSQYAGRFAAVVPPEGGAVAAASQPRPLSQILSSPTPGETAAPSLSQTDVDSYLNSLSSNLGSIFPEGAFPAISYGSGPDADARRGVGIATALEMLEVPALLGQRDSQAFLDELFVALSSATNDPKVLATLGDARKELAVPKDVDQFDPEERFGESRVYLNDFLNSLSRERKSDILIGSAAADWYYIASYGRDAKDNSYLTKTIRSTTDVDASVPGLASARERLASVKSGDWLDIRAKSLVVVNLIMGSN